MSSRIPSPGRSQGGITPRRSRSRFSKSQGSPAHYATLGRPSTQVTQFTKDNMDSFALSPLTGRSVLTDNTDVEEPRRKSWWKKLNDSSRDVIEVLSQGDAPDNVIEELEVEILSQEKKNYSIDLPESSDSESISSIVLPQRKLFNHKDNIPSEQNYGKILSRRDSRTKHQKTHIEINDDIGPKKLFGQITSKSKSIFPANIIDTSINKTHNDPELSRSKKLFGKTLNNKSKATLFPSEVTSTSPNKLTLDENVATKNLFQKPSAITKTAFPSALLAISPDKTIGNKTREFQNTQVQAQSRPLFGNKAGSKRKNMFADFIVSESEDEVPEIQPQVFAFPKKRDELQRASTASYVTDVEMDDWKMLPSSTMMEQLEEMVNTPKKPKLSVRASSQNAEKLKEFTAEQVELRKSPKDKHVSTVEQVLQDMGLEVNIQNKISHEEVLPNTSKTINKDKTNDPTLTLTKNISEQSQNAQIQEIAFEKNYEDEQVELQLTYENDEEHDDRNNSDAYYKMDDEVLESVLESDEDSQNETLDEKRAHEDNKSVSSSKLQEHLILINKANSIEETGKVQLQRLAGDIEQVLEDAEQEKETDESLIQNYDYELVEKSADNIEKSQDKEHSANDMENLKTVAEESTAEDQDDKEESIVEQEEEMSESAVSERNEEQDMETPMDDQEESDEEMEENNEESDASDKEPSEQEADESDAEQDNNEESFVTEPDSSDVDGENEDEQDQQTNGPVIESDGEMEDSPNVTDTTGQLRQKTPNSSEVNSPEAILCDQTNKDISYEAKVRNTSARKTKSMVKLSLAPSIRDSLGEGSSKNSTSEGSGWDSHRITKKTLRQTFGKDFTPRKSLRALVMEKTAQRQTLVNNDNQESIRLPQANSTEINQEVYIETSTIPDAADISEQSDHEISRRTRQATLEMYLQKVKNENMEKRKKSALAVRESLNVQTRNIWKDFDVPTKPQAVRKPKPAVTKPKAKVKPSAVFLGELPPEFLEDIKYKPPKRYQPRNASWATKRLYKFLETKLELKYDYKARVRAEKLVEALYSFATLLKRHDVAPRAVVADLKHEMARLGVVHTHHEFYDFFQDFMPREIRIKVIPDVVNRLPLPREGVFAPILPESTRG